MSEYLVRWKFGPNSMLNKMDHETDWYQFIYPDKKKALDTYTSWLNNASPAMALTIEIFVLEKLIPGQPEPDVILTQIGTGKQINATKMSRNDRIMEMHIKGYSTREIATTMDLSYQAVYGVIRKQTKGK